MALHITGDANADALLDRDPFALLLGMLLDQQIPLEKAFSGPAVLAQRLGTDPLDPSVIALMDPAAFASVMAGPPAVHRYHTSMAGRVQALAAQVVERYGGDPRAIWADAASGAELTARLRALPGFGDQKARIFTALLAKQRGVRPPGWEEAAGDYALQGHRSVADVVDTDSLIKVREVKRAAKAAARAGRR
ncbi:MAG TPA: HhH-GPD-type base excision DNA repair protein [Kineosporiaceae bacterium]